MQLIVDVKVRRMSEIMAFGERVVDLAIVIKSVLTESFVAITERFFKGSEMFSNGSAKHRNKSRKIILILAADWERVHYFRYMLKCTSIKQWSIRHTILLNPADILAL